MKFTYLALLWGFLGNLCAQQLIFRSGFEPGSTVINQTKDGADITGTDRSVAAPNDWVGDLEGSPYVGRFNLQYQDRDGNQQKKRRAEIVGDPTGSGRGRVLKYWILEDHVTYGRGRIQANMYEAETGVREYYHRFKMYLPAESFRPLLDADEGFGFLTITEIWNDNNWRPAFGTPDAYPYRVSLNISRPEASDRNLYLRATGEQQSRSCCWGEGDDKKWETVSDYALPLDTWLDVEFYLKEGDDKTGRVQVAVTPAGGSKRLVVDVTGYTRHPDDPNPDGVKYSNPLKMYTSAGSTLDKVRAAGDTLKIYWDDFEFWRDRRIDLQEPTGCGPTVNWQNQSFTPAGSNTYQVRWTATPGGNKMNGLVGLSDGPAGAYGDLACIVRFNPEGYIDARSGGSYTAQNAIPYTAGTSYRVRLAVNQANRTYSAFVTPAGGQEQTIGTNLAYRSEQAQVSQLNHYAAHSERCTVEVSDFSATATNAAGGRVLIRARGAQGSERMRLRIDGQVVKTWENVATTARNYTYDGYRGGNLQVVFDNDGGSWQEGTDRNLGINYVDVCGVRYENNAPGVSREGCGTDNDRGFAWLWCDGNLDFGSPGCAATANVALPLAAAQSDLTLGRYPRDAAGWTLLDPARTDNVIYVSASGGNDITGKVYTYPNPLIGGDPQQPAGAVQAFRTVAVAAASIGEGGAATWILLKRGDVFSEGLVTKQGLSAEKPLVYSYYGSSGEQPLLKTGSGPGIRHCCDNFADFWVIGLSFVAHTRNPDNGAYKGPEGSEGFFFNAGTGKVVQRILIEGCSFSWYTNNVLEAAGIRQGKINDIALRRNTLSDNYAVEGHAQGLFTNDLDDITLEENIFDHNGWYRQSTDPKGHPEEGGQATQFNHNTYFANVQGARFTGNSFYRPSSIGTKWTANYGEGSATDLEISNNLYHDCEVGISAEGNARKELPYRFANVTVRDNVISSPGLSRPTLRRLGWGIWLNDWNKGKIFDNLVIHQNNEQVRNGRGIWLEGENREVSIRDNILYDLSNTQGIIVENATLENVSIAENLISTSNKARVSIYPPLPSYPFSGNTYASNDAAKLSFSIDSTARTLEEWQRITGENDLATTLPDYSDPDRSLERYVTEQLGLTGLEAFYAELRKLNKLNWRPTYTARAINDWIRAGFSTSGGGTTGGGGRILVRAKSSQGSERMRLQVDGQTVKTWEDVATAPANYTYEGYTGGNIRVVFDDDGGSGPTDRNLAVNYLIVCGTTIQSDAPGVTRSACGTDNDRGFAWLYCPGNFDFGNPGCGTAASTLVPPPAHLRRLDDTASFAIYPNPAHHQLTIVATDHYQFTLYNSGGQLVVQRQLSGTAQVDVSHLPPGVYTASLRPPTQQARKLRVVIQ